MFDAENPLTQAAQEQMQSLWDAGSEAYTDQQKLRAAEIYGKALEIAESINDTRKIVKYRFWRGASLFDAGKLRQALAVLTPTLKDGNTGGDAADIYNTLATYIDIAQELPVNLGAIEKAYQQTENFLRDSGNLEWRHLLLFLQATLYKLRGMYPEALAAAQESWTIWEREYPSYTADTHLNSLVQISLLLRDVEQAQMYLWEWEMDEHDEIPKEREEMSCSRRSNLARLQGRFTEAVDWARRAMLVDNSNIKTLIVMVRAFLCTGDNHRARDELIRLLAHRHAETGHERYYIRLLWGDYHLACAREAAGMPAVDDEFGLEFPPPSAIANPAATCYALARARRGYRAALKVGSWIDEKLQCSLRQTTISERLARVEAIERKL
jgi:tetratricopeptide (TPR) repeat protein